MPIYTTFLAVCILVDPKPKMPMLFSDGIYFSAWWYLSKILLKFMGASIDFSTFFYLHLPLILCLSIYSTSFDIKKEEFIHTTFFSGKFFRQQQRRRKIFFFFSKYFCETKAFLCSVWTIFYWITEMMIIEILLWVWNYYRRLGDF